jgi:RNA polymerase sigma factor FliA
MEENMLNELWQNYFSERAEGKSVHFRNLLVEHYRDMVVCSAKRIKKHLPRKFILDDLISAGVVGLVDAMEKYETSRGEFDVYAPIRIRGEIIDEIRRYDDLPRKERRLVSKISKALDGLCATGGFRSYDVEVREELGIGQKEYDRLMGILRAHVSLQTFGYKDGVSLVDLIEEDKPSNLKDVYGKDLRESLLGGLAKRDQEIIKYYFYEGLTMKRTAELVGLSESRISRTISELLIRLKDKLTTNLVLKNELEEITLMR